MYLDKGFGLIALSSKLLLKNKFDSSFSKLINPIILINLFIYAFANSNPILTIGSPIPLLNHHDLDPLH